MTARLIRSIRATDADTALDSALDELEKARSTEQALRKLVAEGKASAASLATAQWSVQTALRRLDGLAGQPPAPAPKDAA